MRQNKVNNQQQGLITFMKILMIHLKKRTILGIFGTNFGSKSTEMNGDQNPLKK